MKANTKIGWVTEAIVPQRDKPTDLGGPIPWLRIEDFDGKYLSASKSGQGVTAAQVEAMPLRVFPRGTVVTSCSCTMGTTAIADTDVVTNQTFIGLVPRPDLVSADFLYYYLQSAKDELQARSSGSIQQYLSKQEFQNLRLWLPSLAAQRRIAGFLDDRVDRIDRIMAARRVQIQDSAKLLDSQVAHDCLGQPATPVRRFLSLIRTGATPDTTADTPGGLPWFTPGNFAEDLSLLDPTRRVARPSAVHFPAGSVLLVAIGATAGKVAWLPRAGTGNQQLTCLTPQRGLLSGRFLLHQLNAHRERLRLSAPASTLPILNNEIVKDFPLWVPVLSTQTDLADRWDRQLAQAREVARELVRSIDLLTEYKSSLITAAVTGDLDVTTAGSGVPG